MNRSSFVLVLSLAACGGGGTSVFVGKAEGSELAVGWALEGGVVRAYACGGPTTYGDDTRWFDAAADASGAFSGTTDGWTFAGSAASATVTPPSGEPLSIAVHEPLDDREGLYATVDSGCSTGAVVWNDAGGAPRLQGTWCDEQGNSAQVTPVLPITVIDLGIEVTVDLAFLGLGTRELVVHRVVP